jgi:hypothetical protein
MEGKRWLFFDLTLVAKQIKGKSCISTNYSFAGKRLLSLGARTRRRKTAFFVWGSANAWTTSLWLAFNGAHSVDIFVSSLVTLLSMAVALLMLFRYFLNYL